MQIQLRSGAEFYLDGLLVECILADLRARNLASVAMVCRSLRLPAQAAAYRALTRIVDRMQCKLMERYERGSSWVKQLREWEALDAANKVWLQAAAPNVVTVEKRGEGTFVKRVGDLSGNGYGATMHQQMPALRQDAINGHAAFDFDGHAVLKTIPFAEPMQQPVTLIVVARARGDTTIVDSLTPSSSRFEVCHGYPTGWHPSPEICMTASGEAACSKVSPLGAARARLLRTCLAGLGGPTHSQGERPGHWARSHHLWRSSPPLPKPPRSHRPSPTACALLENKGGTDSPKYSARGSTRGTGEWHVYTAVFDHKKSEMYVDGNCEASGKNVGSNSLDGLSLGCDHTGVFYLTGMIAELRLYNCHMPAAQRVQTEAALARRYALDYTDAPSLPPSPSRGLASRIASCMPRYSEGDAASTADP